jgi:hypothetical protein
VPGGRGRDGLALEIGDLRDVGAHRHPVRAVALVHLEDLLRRHAARIPHDPRLDGRGRALDIAGRDGEVAVLLRNHLERHVEAVLLEDPGILGEREGLESGPAGHADRDFGFLGGDRTVAAKTAAAAKASVFCMDISGMRIETMRI